MNYFAKYLTLLKYKINEEESKAYAGPEDLEGVAEFVRKCATPCFLVQNISPLKCKINKRGVKTYTGAEDLE
jgi:hypothetical protein